MVVSSTSSQNCHLYGSITSHRKRRVSCCGYHFSNSFFTSGDIQYISRLIRLINHFVPASVLNTPGTGYKHGKYCMLPFDKFYDPETGQDDLNRTTFVRYITSVL